MQTLIPFMKKLREACSKHHPGRVVADSGYESEESFLCRGPPKVSAEWLLLAIAANILKLHNKHKNDRLGTGLVIPKGFPVGL